MILLIIAVFTFILNSDLDKVNQLYKNKNYQQFLNQCIPLLKDNIDLRSNLNLQLKIANASKELNQFDRAITIYKQILNTDTIITDYVDFELLQLNLLVKDTMSYLNNVEPFIIKHSDFSQNERILKKAINIVQNKFDTIQYFKFSSLLINLNENYKPQIQFEKIKLIQDQNDFLKESIQYIGNFSQNRNNDILFDSMTNKIDISILPDNEKYNLFKSSVILKNEFSKNIFNNYSDFENYDKYNLYLSRYHLNFKNYNDFIEIINTVEDSIEKLPRDIARELPRVYMRLNNYELAYKHYLNFARYYPDDAFSLNAVTFVLNKYIKSNPQKYISILTEFANTESKYQQYYRFLYIIYLYENSSFQRSLSKIDEYILKTNSKWHLDRLKFWKSKVLFELNRNDEAFLILSDLAQNPLDNYYTIKSYVALVLNDKNKNTLIELGIRNHDKPLQRISKDERFIRLNLISEVFGRDYLKFEIESVRNSFKSKDELSEIISFFEENSFYYHAYIYNHRLNREYFKDKSYQDKKDILNRMFPTYYLGMIDSIADPLKLQDPLVNAIIYRESAFQQDAVSKADAHGLMQLIPSTADLMSRRYRIPYDDVYDLYQPETNIALGTHFLEELLKRFNNNYEVALAAYNAGATRAKRWIKEFDPDNTDLFIEKIPFEQTRTYVKKVMYAYYIYKLIDFYDSDIYYSGIRKR